MPTKSNSLIETYINTRHIEDKVKRHMALRDVVLCRMDEMLLNNPLGREDRFSELKNLCETGRGQVMPVDEALREECHKIGVTRNLTDSLVYGDQVIKKVNAFSQRHADCHKQQKPFVLKLDMAKVANLDDIPFKSLLYCIQQFKPALKITHLFSVHNSGLEDMLLGELPEDLSIHIDGVKAGRLLSAKTELLFTAISKAKSVSLHHCDLGRWTTEDIGRLYQTLKQNSNLRVLDLCFNELYRWSDPHHPEKLEALKKLISLPGLKEVNIRQNDLDKLTDDEKVAMRQVISDALENGLCKINAPQTLESPGVIGCIKYLFFTTGEGNCPDTESKKQSAAVSLQ